MSIKRKSVLLSACIVLTMIVLSGCKPAEQAAPATSEPVAGATSAAATANAEETRAIAKEAYLYGFPMVESYKTLYAQAVDSGDPNFKAPLNELKSAANRSSRCCAITTPPMKWQIASGNARS